MTYRLIVSSVPVVYDHAHGELDQRPLMRRRRRATSLPSRISNTFKEANSQAM